MGSGDRAAGDVIENGSEDSAGGESGGMGMGMGSKSGSNDLLDAAGPSPPGSSGKGGSGKGEGGKKGNGGYSGVSPLRRCSTATLNKPSLY